MIVYKKTVALKEGQKLFIVPFGDVHYNVAACDKDRFHRLIKWCEKKKAHEDKVALIGLGDYNDALSSSERAAIVGAKGGQGLHDTTIELLDGIAKKLTEDFAEVLRPVAEDVLGLVEGHHFMTITDRTDPLFGQTTTEYLCSKLGCTYFGDMALIRLAIGPKGLPLEIGVHHGAGSAATMGGRLAKRQRVGGFFPHAQLILLGHDHSKVAGVDQGIVVDDESEDGIAVMKRYYIGTGSFLKGYEVGKKHGGYVEKGLLPPGDLGVSIIKVEAEERNGKHRLDFHVSI